MDRHDPDTRIVRRAEAAMRLVGHTGLRFRDSDQASWWLLPIAQQHRVSQLNVDSKTKSADGSLDALTLLHSLGHDIADQDGVSGHGDVFVETVRQLYSEHISPEAALIFDGCVMTLRGLPQSRQSSVAEALATIDNLDSQSLSTDAVPPQGASLGAFW